MLDTFFETLCIYDLMTLNLVHNVPGICEIECRSYRLTSAAISECVIVSHRLCSKRFLHYTHIYISVCVACQEIELIAVKTKGGMRFVSPSSSKKLPLTGTGSSVSTRPTDTHTTTTGAASTAVTGGRSNKQSATVSPTTQLAKVMKLID